MSWSRRAGWATAPVSFARTIIERDLRDSVGSTIYSGTNEIQRNIIARQLRL
jgi:alkylation response protein AidB-like acyl-CoA dehydrogenase